MNTFLKYAVILAGCMMGLGACTSDKESSTSGGKTVIDQPQVLVSEVTTSGFTLQWDAVANAGTYVYTFNGSEATEITERRISFRDLERQKEYVVAVKALPKFADEYTESPYTYVHVITDDLEQLPQPEITLGCAYSSKTIISWTEIPESAAYEYTIDGQTYTTKERTVTLSGLGKGRDYTFTVRAMTSDATRFTNSESAELAFTTSSEDVPTLLIAPTQVISDAVEFQVYATSEETYFYDVISASTFAKYDPATIVETYRNQILEYAASQDVSIQLVLASMLKAGTQTLQVTGLVSELSYVIFAFGMDLKGNITSDLSYTTFRTTADGYSDGPNYGGSDWFAQNFYITNAYASLGYNSTNSVWTAWSGDGVAEIHYRTLPTETFRQIFPDENDTEAIKAFLKDEDYAYVAEDTIIAMVNTTGSMTVTAVTAGTSYTLASLAISGSGEETLCVNSVTTKTSAESLSWFLADAVTNEAYGPTYNTIAGIMKGVDVVKVRYGLIETAALQSFSTTQYADVVEKYGLDLQEQYLAAVNGNGLAMLFRETMGVKPSTSYTFIATATNSVGDTTTKWGNVSTTAAPDPGAGASLSKTRAATPLQSLVGEPIPNPERFIYPYPCKPVSKDVKAEGDYWTLIHNMQILK